MGLILALMLQEEWQVSAYAGQAWHLKSDLEYQDVEYGNVEWDDESFESPIYYGFRITYWRDDWGLAIDFHHAKAYLDEERFDPIGTLGISHGYNVLTLNLTHRWLLGGVTPYVGVGIGVVVAHVEADFGGESEDGYQIEAPAAHAMAGVEFDIVRPLAIFVEGKLAYGDLDLQVPGGTVETLLFTPQLVAGLSVRF